MRPFLGVSWLPDNPMAALPLGRLYRSVDVGGGGGEGLVDDDAHSCPVIAQPSTAGHATSAGSAANYQGRSTQKSPRAPCTQ